MGAAAQNKRQKGFVESYIGSEIPQETGLPAQIPTEESRDLHAAPSKPGGVKKVLQKYFIISICVLCKAEQQKRCCSCKDEKENRLKALT